MRLIQLKFGIRERLHIPFHNYSRRHIYWNNGLKSFISITRQIKEIVVQKEIADHCIDAESEVGVTTTRIENRVITTLFSDQDVFLNDVSHHVTGKTRKTYIHNRNQN
ncbi:hypothetical protein CEXT_263191 [Caerostris extrusa]|uniref:Uncharacterized protein n=1 Tax=Caerostris extrusa TaxID=172846 RepID=A0AAV4XPD1_CAEEX|nr:hypothetical protein CEXT_263191 [Caerostris extrusa]